jgi:SnoaL-like protein
VQIIAAMSVESGDPVEIVTKVGAALIPDDLVTVLHDEAGLERLREAMRELVEPDFECVMVGPDYAGSRGDLAYRGIDGFIEAWREWSEAYESYKIEIGEIVGAPGGRVLTLGRQRGTTRTGGVDVEEDAASVWTIRDGRVARVEFHLDPDAARRAAGLAE